MLCGMSTFKADLPQGTTYMRFRCKSWRCPRCSKQRQKKLSKQAYLGKPNKFLTLTVNPDRYKSKNDAARELVVSWRRMREELQRKWKSGPIPFIAVFEECESGWPHLHILMRCGFISQRWISRYMDRRTGAPIVWICAIKSRKKAAAYVAKYVAKIPAQFEGCKRYWSNPDYLPLSERKTKSKFKWELMTSALELISEALEWPFDWWQMEQYEMVVVPLHGPPKPS